MKMVFSARQLASLVVQYSQYTAHPTHCLASEDGEKARQASYIITSLYISIHQQLDCFAILKYEKKRPDNPQHLLHYYISYIQYHIEFLVLLHLTSHRLFWNEIYEKKLVEYSGDNRKS